MGLAFGGAAAVVSGVLSVAIVVPYEIAKQLYSNHKMEKSGEDLIQENYSGGYSF